ncbi:MAG: Arc family DNA-binding protein [Gammaproteobacteria bacterium]|nr:Arc family DNA-binding protein [Gammaproteobacteria bacterium]
MNKISTYPLRLPKSLKDEVARVAERDHTSMNQFIAIAVAEKISALETEEFFVERAKRADLKAFKNILFRPGGDAPRSGDEL